MFYHVRLFVRGELGSEPKFDLSREELETRILGPYRQFAPIIIEGRTILFRDIERIEIVETARDSRHFHDLPCDFATSGAPDWYRGIEGALNVTDEFITTPSVPAPQKNDVIELICSKFDGIVVRLRHRHQDRPTLDVKDEYDVQDLMHSLLRLFFEDIRPEEVVPSYADKSSKMDFLLYAEKTIVETKMTRDGLGAKEIGSQLVEDIARYKAHPRCKRLICFVYDPEGRIANPLGIEQDLSSTDQSLEVSVFIFPRH
jgi:hypothetical protein